MKRIHVIGLCALATAALFCFFVWPTPWVHWDTVTVEKGGFDGEGAVLVDHHRRNRFTGREEADFGGGWIESSPGD